MSLKNWLRAVVYGVPVALCTWAFWIEPDSLRVVEHDVPLIRWPADQAGLRVAMITDLHAGSPWIDRDKLRRVVDMTNSAQPDLILLGGDYVINGLPFGHFIPVEDTAEILGGLRAPLGVYAVTGNHEHRLDDAVSEREAFSRNHIRLIDNQMVRIKNGRYHFWLAGFDELEVTIRHASKMLEPAGDGNGDPIIGLVHNPDVYRSLTKRVNLVIAGHTHGGQVVVPFFGALVFDALFRYNNITPYVSGHYPDVNDLFVSSGIGTSNLGARFRVPPEISVLTLHPYP